MSPRRLGQKRKTAATFCPAGAVRVRLISGPLFDPVVTTPLFFFYFPWERTFTGRLYFMEGLVLGHWLLFYNSESFIKRKSYCNKSHPWFEPQVGAWARQTQSLFYPWSCDIMAHPVSDSSRCPHLASLSVTISRHTFAPSPGPLSPFTYSQPWRLWPPHHLGYKKFWYEKCMKRVQNNTPESTINQFITTT